MMRQFQPDQAVTQSFSAAQDQRESAVACPFCASTQTELDALFGQQLLTVQYYCHACHTPFEYIKDDAVLYDYVERKDELL
ncbi:hypothetical protein [Ktedonobacter racemifer]|nr:hypothetical protein [Ktedonobacter racemifer]